MSARVAGKLFVDALVGVPLQAVVRGFAEGVVVQRPQTIVGEALVVQLDFLGTDLDGMQVDAVDGERVGRVVRIAGPADPGPADAQHR